MSTHRSLQPGTLFQERPHEQAWPNNPNLRSRLLMEAVQNDPDVEYELTTGEREEFDASFAREQLQTSSLFDQVVGSDLDSLAESQFGLGRWFMETDAHFRERLLRSRTR